MAEESQRPRDVQRVNPEDLVDWASSCPDRRRCAKLIEFGPVKVYIWMEPISMGRFKVFFQRQIIGTDWQPETLSAMAETQGDAHKSFNQCMKIALSSNEGLAFKNPELFAGQNAQSISDFEPPHTQRTFELN